MVVSASRIRELLQGVKYPASKQDLIDKAKEKKAGSRIMVALEKLPNKRYDSSIDLLMEYSDITQI